MKKIIKISLFSFLIICLQNNPAFAVNFSLFGDVKYISSDETGVNDAFALGGLDFYATHQISENTRGFVEFVLENTDTGLVTDLERLQITRTFNDSFIFAAGRFHTPLGHWNRTYHHGAILQDTVSRPFFLEFEDGATGILPLHIVGVMATGSYYINSGELSYEFGLGNGPSLDTTAGYNPPSDNKPEIDINVTSDVNGQKSTVLRGIYEINDIPLQTAIFIMNNDIAESNGGTGAVAAKGVDLVKQIILGFDLFYDDDTFDVLAEYYDIQNENKVGSSGTYTGTAYYVQFGYRITETLKAIARYENLEFNSNDSYFRLLGTQEASHNVIGLRYDLDDANTLKIEINQTDLKTGIDTTTSTLQWAFLIP